MTIQLSLAILGMVISLSGLGIIFALNSIAEAIKQKEST